MEPLFANKEKIASPILKQVSSLAVCTAYNQVLTGWYSKNKS